jgi:hypothetical protein
MIPEIVKMLPVGERPLDYYKFTLFIIHLVGEHKVDETDIINVSLYQLYKRANEKLPKVSTPVDIQQPGDPVLGCGSCPLKSQYIRRYGRDH